MPARFPAGLRAIEIGPRGKSPSAVERNRSRTANTNSGTRDTENCLAILPGACGLREGARAPAQGSKTRDEVKPSAAQTADGNLFEASEWPGRDSDRESDIRRAARFEISPYKYYPTVERLYSGKNTPHDSQNRVVPSHNIG